MQEQTSTIELDGSIIRWNGEALVLPSISAIREIGSGAHGKVFEGFDQNLERRVAIKVWFRPYLISGPRALGEVRKLAKFKSGVFVNIYNTNIEGQVPWSVMEYLPGITMRAWLEDAGVRSRQVDLPVHLKANASNLLVRCHLWRQYSEGLKIIHKNGTVHGDPHVGNVLVMEPMPKDMRRLEDSHSRYQTIRSKLKLLDLGTSLLWSNVADFHAREAQIIYETARKIFRDIDPRKIIRIEESICPEPMLNLMDNLVRYISYLASIPTMSKDDFAAMEHDLPQLLGGCPFFDYTTVASQLRPMLHAGEADRILRYALDFMATEEYSMHIASPGLEIDAYRLSPDECVAALSEFGRTLRRSYYCGSAASKSFQRRTRRRDRR